MITLSYDPKAIRKQWNQTVMNFLIKSGKFCIKEEPMPSVKPVAPRWRHFSFFKLNDKLFGLDTWDTTIPTTELFSNGFFNGLNLYGIFKIQYLPNKQYCDIENTGIKVFTLPVFPGSHFPLSYFSWENKAHKYLTLVTGTNHRFGRQIWVDTYKNSPDIICTEKLLELAKFLAMLKETKWGLILHGKFSGGAGKNRREVEFASLGMPMALNYRPYYLKENVDYVYVDQPNDLIKLRLIDPEPFAAASKQLWLDYYSPNAVASAVERCL